jgi:hypothetical protein
MKLKHVFILSLALGSTAALAESDRRDACREIVTSKTGYVQQIALDLCLESRAEVDRIQACGEAAKKSDKTFPELVVDITALDLCLDFETSLSQVKQCGKVTRMTNGEPQLTALHLCLNTQATPTRIDSCAATTKRELGELNIIEFDRCLDSTGT